MNFSIHANAVADINYPPRIGRRAPLKYLLIMKLIILLTIGFSIQASADALGQNITLSAKEASFKTVLQSVQRQSGYSFMITSALMEQAQPVTINVKSEDIAKVLPILFKGQPFTYEVSGKLIKVIPTENPKVTSLPLSSIQQNIRGRVTDSLGNPLQGVTVQVKESGWQTITDRDGRYEIAGVYPTETLHFRLLGHEPYETQANRPVINVTLEETVSEISEVQVTVNTGYQNIPKERATGSFVQVDNDLLNRRVSTNVLDRLEGVASGIRFNTQTSSSEARIQVRGRSTIMSNTEPLIILDNFPYDGDLNNINPNSIESITVLRDAAAASIWGARSANGVIVITTKKGQYNQPFKVEVNTNVTIGQKPDLYYSPNFVSTDDFIEVESFLFERGAYDSKLNNATVRPLLSPLVEMLARRKEGLISESDSTAFISGLRGLDVRDDLMKYFYQNSIFQQYALNVSGGSDRGSYILSAGYDNNKSSQVRNGYDRFTLMSNTNFTPIKNLELNAGILYTQSRRQNHNSGFSPTMGLGGGMALYPYAQFADAQGNALVVPRDYRQTFKDTTGVGHLLDWNYRPLDELHLSNNTNQVNHVRINSGLKYTFIRGLNAEFRYQHERQNGLTKELQGQNTYFVRNLVNRYSSLDGSTLTRNIPLGDILDQTHAEIRGTRLRGQIDFNRDFSTGHHVSAIAGIETGQTITSINTGRLYGYNDDNATHISALDYRARYPLWQNVGTAAIIPYSNAVAEQRDVNVSYYANAAYSYKNRFIISGSARIDQSNLFGVDFNQKGVPLWSVGGAWKLSDEQFYGIDWMPYLRLRTTYGYNGNVNKSVAALFTANYSASANEFGLFTATPNNPPNPNLRWEKIAIFNVAIDFGLLENAFTGSLEYYFKDGKELIGDFPVAASTGMGNFTGNVADIKGKGVDLDLNGQLTRGRFNWQVHLLTSYNMDRVSKYYNTGFNASTAVASGDGVSGFIVPYEGRPVYSVYSYKWAGLDPETGDPRGYLDGEISKEYTALTSPASLDELVYNGPARPSLFGGLRNTFRYKRIGVSINLSYKMGYYFRANTINYSSFFGSYSSAHSDISKRWRTPGDEQRTNIPSMVYPTNQARERLYEYSEILVHKGNHIRLQDITLDYDLNHHLNQSRIPVKNIVLYLYANNLGIIWKSNNSGLDPDFVSGFPNPRTIAFGFRLSL